MPEPAPLSPESLGGRITLRSDLMAIRHGLAQLLAMSPLQELSDAARGTAEIVLAEALNNIVEHAYAECSGDVCVAVTRCDGDILCEIRDHGRPMPPPEITISVASVCIPDPIPCAAFAGGRLP